MTRWAGDIPRFGDRSGSDCFCENYARHSGTTNTYYDSSREPKRCNGRIAKTTAERHELFGRDAECQTCYTKYSASEVGDRCSAEVCATCGGFWRQYNIWT